MAEIRKLLERLNNKKEYPILNFYCNWTLHTQINDTSSVEEILNKIEESILKQKYNTREVMKIIDFELFRNEIGNFLEKNFLNNNFNDMKYWRNFRKIFIKILINCPLNPRNGEMKEFCFIESNENDINFIIKFKNHIPMNGSFTFINN